MTDTLTIEKIAEIERITSAAVQAYADHSEIMIRCMHQDVQAYQDEVMGDPQKILALIAMAKRSIELEAIKNSLLKDWSQNSLHGRLQLLGRAEKAEAEVKRLMVLLNTPEIADFLRAVEIEMPHQRERWGTDHDSGKTDADWFWLIGYLAGKALHNPPNDMQPFEAKLHRIVTIAAAAGNWHAAVSGSSTSMRPGIMPPEAIAAGDQPWMIL